MRLSIEFSLAAVVALILFFVAGKNNTILNILLLAALFGFCLHPALSLPWIRDAQPPSIKYWRILTVISILLIGVVRFGIWVWPPAQKKMEAISSSTTNYPHIQFKKSDQHIFQAAYAITATVACFRNDEVSGQQIPFYAQIIYKDAGGREIANVARGTWFPLNSKHPTRTTFDTGVARSLGIFFLREGEVFKPVIEWIRERLAGSYGLFPQVAFEKFTDKIAWLRLDS